MSNELRFYLGRDNKSLPAKTSIYVALNHKLFFVIGSYNNFVLADAAITELKKKGYTVCEGQLPVLADTILKLEWFDESGSQVHRDTMMNYAVEGKEKISLAEQYPQYHKPVPKVETIDTYVINQLFPVDDPSGCILHARKKLLIPGVRTGGKSMHKDVKEAIATLQRWLDLNPEENQ